MPLLLVDGQLPEVVSQVAVEELVGNYEYQQVGLAYSLVGDGVVVRPEGGVDPRGVHHLDPVPVHGPCFLRRYAHTGCDVLQSGQCPEEGRFAGAVLTRKGQGDGPLPFFIGFWQVFGQVPHLSLLGFRECLLGPFQYLDGFVGPPVSVQSLHSASLSSGCVLDVQPRQLHGDGHAVPGSPKALVVGDVCRSGLVVRGDGIRVSSPTCCPADDLFI